MTFIARVTDEDKSVLVGYNIDDTIVENLLRQFVETANVFEFPDLYNSRIAKDNSVELVRDIFGNAVITCLSGCHE